MIKIKHFVLFTVITLLFINPVIAGNSTHNYSSHFDNLFSDVDVWDMLSAIFGSYEDICTTNLFWLSIIIIPFIITWIKQQSVIMPSIIALIVGGVLFVSVPNEAIGAIKVLLILGVTGLIYHLYKSRY